MKTIDEPRIQRGYCSHLIAAHVPGGRIPKVRACRRKGTVEHDGKRYCRQHAPKRTDVELTAIYAVHGTPPRVHVAYGVLTEKQWTADGVTSVAFRCHRRLERNEIDLTPEAAIDRWRTHRRRELADTIAFVEELRVLIDTTIDPTPVDARSR